MDARFSARAKHGIAWFLLLCAVVSAQNGSHSNPQMSSLASYSQTVGYSVGALSPSYPTNASGQTMIAVVSVGRVDGNAANPTVTGPAGWTSIVDNSSFGIGAYFGLWRKAGDGSTGSISWSFGGASVSGEVAILCYNGLDTTSPVDDSDFNNESATSSSHTAASSTATQAGDLIVRVWSGYAASRFPYPGPTTDYSDVTGLTTRASFTGGANPDTEDGIAMLITDEVQIASGATATRIAFSNSGFGGSSVFAGQSITLALKQTPNPSTPSVTFTNGGESLTQGAAVLLTCSTATSPTAASSSLQYEFGYTTNGVSYTALALSSAGVPSKTLTVPSVITSLFKTRVRSYDPALTLYSDYAYSSAFSSIVAETAPPAPSITAPSVGSINNKASAVTIAWTYGGGLGNPQTEYTIQWSRDNFASHTATVGPTSSSATSTTIDYSGETSGATISVKVKTKGLSLYSVYSAVRQFIVASAPSTPVITAPTSASPPAVPKPTHAFTEADAFVSRRVRVTENGAQVYDSGVVSSSATSFASPVTYHSGIATVLYLSVYNSYGLQSAEASQSFTPSFSPPAKPTITITSVAGDANGNGGYNQVQIANSDTPDYNDLYRYQANTTDCLLLENGDYFLLESGDRLLLEDDASARIRIATQVAVDGSFQDYNVASGVTYNYVAQAVIAATSLTTDSDAASGTVTLATLQIHEVNQTSSSNAANSIGLWNQPSASYGESKGQALAKTAGRGFVGGSGVITRRSLTQSNVITRFADQSRFDSFMASYRGAATLCCRDQFGNLLFGSITGPKTTKGGTTYNQAFDFVESDFDEEV